MKRYAIWDKVSPIITPIGEVLSAEQWINKYPVAGLAHITVVCSAGEINGGFFGTLGQMCQMYETQGCDFSACTTPEEMLEAIEVFDAVKEAEAAERAANAAATEELNATSLASIAASMEFQNMMSLPDEEV